MTDYKLIKLDLDSYKYFDDIKREYKENNIEFYSHSLIQIMTHSNSKKEWKDFYNEYSKILLNGDIANGLVPSTVFFIFDNKYKKPVGIIDVRKYLNEFLFLYGGHIGYEIFPASRNKKILYQVADELKKYCKNNINSFRVMITCDQQNIASKKIISKLNGQLIYSVKREDTNKIVERYWCYL